MKRFIVCLLVAGVAISLASQDKPLDAYISEAQVLQGEEKFQDAVDLMAEAVQVYPEESSAHLHCALAWSALSQHASQSGDYMKAMEAVNGTFEAFKQAAKLDPEDYDIRFNYGMFGINVPPFFGKLNTGVEQLEKALEIAKRTAQQNVPVVYRFLGQGYFGQERYERAKEAWEAVLAMVPEGELADGARAGLEKIEQVKPQEEETGETVEVEEDVEQLVSRGQALYDKGDWPEATKVLKKAVRLDTENADLQFLLAQSVMMDAATDYDERIYENTDFRTHLAFETAEQLERAYELAPNDPEIKRHYAVSCIQMPFFVGRIDKGLALLEEMAAEDLPEGLKAEVMYQLGFGYRKKGHAVWMKLVKDMPGEPRAQSVYEEYGLREYRDETVLAEGERVVIMFHLGFMDELAPQTGLWIEDDKGNFVKTLYVSGFSGYAKEKQINLFDWAKKSEFETDGMTAASVDWGKHTYVWDLTDRDGKRVNNGTYRVHIEAAWWPSMKYGRTFAEIRIGDAPGEVSVAKEPFIPMMRVEYIR